MSEWELRPDLIAAKDAALSQFFDDGKISAVTVPSRRRAPAIAAAAKGRVPMATGN